MPAVGELLKTKDAAGRASPRAGRPAADSADNPAEQPFSLVRDAGTFVGMKPGPCEWPFDYDRPWRDRSASVQSVARETSSLPGARLRCNARWCYPHCPQEIATSPPAGADDSRLPCSSSRSEAVGARRRGVRRANPSRYGRMALALHRPPATRRSRKVRPVERSVPTRTRWSKPGSGASREAARCILGWIFATSAT